MGRATLKCSARVNEVQGLMSNSTAYSRGDAYDSGMALHSVLVTEINANILVDIRILLDAADQTDAINKVPTQTSVLIELIKYT